MEGGGACRSLRAHRAKIVGRGSAGRQRAAGVPHPPRTWGRSWRAGRVRTPPATCQRRAHACGAGGGASGPGGAARATRARSRAAAGAARCAARLGCQQQPALRASLAGPCAPGGVQQIRCPRRSLPEVSRDIGGDHKQSVPALVILMDIRSTHGAFERRWESDQLIQTNGSGHRVLKTISKLFITYIYRHCPYSSAPAQTP